jgi:hypothetical protein
VACFPGAWTTQGIRVLVWGILVGAESCRFAGLGRRFSRVFGSRAVARRRQLDTLVHHFCRKPVQQAFLCPGKDGKKSVFPPLAASAQHHVSQLERGQNSNSIVGRILWFRQRRPLLGGFLRGDRDLLPLAINVDHGDSPEGNQIHSGHQFGSKCRQKFSVPSQQAKQHGCDRTSSAGDRAPTANRGNTKICSASAAMARIIATRKRDRGGSETHTARRLPGPATDRLSEGDEPPEASF